MKPLLAAAALVGVLGCSQEKRSNSDRGPIPVGILHSLTGTMALSEKPVVDATLLAIDQINQRGGVLGRQLRPIIADGASDWPTFAQKADSLIQNDKVAVVFGCWTSASRKTVRPVFERRNHLLFYPVQYEGLEQSPNIVYTGAAPNQQITPAVVWAVDTLKKRRLYLVGSDYVFPRSANAIIRDVARGVGVEIVGEQYLPLGSTDVAATVADIVATKPDIILNTINGDSNIAFFKALRKANIHPSTIPTISFSIAEPELATLPAEDVAGDYAAWNYFQSLPTRQNQAFIKAYRARYGAKRVVSDPLEAAYTGVMLWAKAAQEAGSIKPAEVLASVGDLGFDAPEGVVFVDPETHHLWKTVRIGRIRSDQQFDIVWESGRPVRPVPYPITRPREKWETFLTDLQNQWGGAWARPVQP